MADAAGPDATSPDPIEVIQGQWRDVRPDLDPSPIAVFGRLSRASRAAEALMNATFAPHGFDRSAFDVLVTIRRAGEPYCMTSRELQETALVTSAAVAQRLNRLEDRGLVRRAPHPGDGRVTDVHLTDAGFAAADGAMADHMATEARMLAHMTPAERDELGRLLARLLESPELR